ncbi:endo-alpha-N-acetylgalactosaminidase family protein [Specibacter cremeus]|uniref:endo-alpha-N-acetylgalactosaminidase family protein n=1 Tax=Specibacter cremeus TaxID=1629051 RepID=UPI000F7AF676|nr:endo-alpha-N-acetylgalactosaminidase family protein [Specibacter cremeus]
MISTPQSTLPDRRASRGPRDRRAALARTLATAVTTASLVAALSVGTGAVAAHAAPDSSGTPITPSQYTLIGADSQSPAYPAPPALDGTAVGAFDNDYSSQWTVAYKVVNGVGVADPMPHWISWDVGGSFTLTGLDYSVKNQANGPIKDFKVFATNDRAIATDPKGDWGAPVATGSFVQPTSNTQVQTVLFNSPVKARYVKFEADSAVNGSNNASASELRVRATGDTTPQPVPPAPPADPATPVKISNGKGLDVLVGKEFPQVISYSLGGKSLAGQADKLKDFTLNGKNHAAATTMTATPTAATYTSTFADFPNLAIESSLTVTPKNTVEFAVTKISGSAATTLDQLAIPNQSLVSVDSADPRAQLARTRISTDSTTTADQFVSVTGTTKTDAADVGTPYGFVSNSQLSAGLMTNATDDSAQDSNVNWNTRLQSRIVDAGNGAKRAELSVGNYTYAAAGATDPRVLFYQLPKTTVVLSADANNDGKVTWEDGAIAFRNAMTAPLGASRVPERVVQHIPFNFASEAANPFLKTLDNVKRISQSTDDLGQWVLEKGYANEGHDSGHPDYGGDYNTRAGGLTDLNTLASKGAAYNADLAVHVNVTEAYPQAKSFSSGMISGQANGWDWLNQSYHIDQRKDLGTGAILDRFAELHKEAPGIKTVYIDAYYSSGWLADQLATQLHKMGFEVASEWAYKFEGNSIWSHWANDKNYGGATNKGINSSIVRFIANTQRDVWNTDPLLGGAQLKEFEGWTGQDDWNAFYNNIWVNNLPTKFLQHFDVTNWDFGKSATLTGGVAINMVNGQRQISMGNAVVLDGGTYLLPWQDAVDNSKTTSPLQADKMYFYSATGGTTTFTLTSQFANTRNFTLYKLRDQGRTKVADVINTNGTVTLTGDKGVPYVLAPNGDKPVNKDAGYGDGSMLVDPGFNAGNLDAWNPSGGAAISRTATGDNVAVLGTSASSISQTVKKLEKGKKYTLSANVEITAGNRRAVTLGVTGKGVDASNTFDITPAKNQVAADAKQGTYSQRASVQFTAPVNQKVDVFISAVAGSAAVTLDDVRIMEDTTTPVAGAPDGPGTLVASANFEGNQPGWGPFVKGDAGGATDPRTSISNLHAPYSQKEWKNTYSPYNSGTLNGQAVDDVLDGNNSLKSHEENTGLVYRTVPATIPFTAGHSYAVSFKYQTNIAGQWQWVTGADTVSGGTVTSRDLKDEAMAPALNTATYSRTFTAGCGDNWVGLRKTGAANGADFVIDDFTVTDLGVVTGGAACASVAGPANADLNPGTTNSFVTTFTNNEATEATNVAMSLGTLPAGWSAQVAAKDGNLAGTVKPGATAKTTWIITTPAGAAGTTTVIHPAATYFNNCATKTVDSDSNLAVSSQAMVPTSAMTATADSENLDSGPGEGPAANVLDGDPSTIWHTQYDPTITNYPHWLQLNLNSTYTVNGFGYQGRQSGGQNGKVKGYTIFTSMDGTTWTQVATGNLVDTTAMQNITFPAVQAKFVKFQANSAINGLQFAAAAEMRVYGTGGTALAGFDPSPRPADTACTP